jgi:stage IV sporulation protein B
MGMVKQGVKSILAVFNILVLSLAALLCYYSFSLPDSFYVTSGAEVGPLPEYISAKRSRLAPVMSGDSVQDVELVLFGVIPVKNVTVFDIGTPMLIPSGEPFGIKMLSDGAVVTDVNGFETADGFVSPAKDAGIRAGDVIAYIDGKKVHSNADIIDIIKSGKPVNITLMRKDEEKTVLVTPALSAGGGYKIGLWVKDSSAGIGTLTFYDAAGTSFAGLGHPVCDASSGALMPLYSGEAVKVFVNGIVRGRPGYPGELTGLFDAKDEIGKLLVNDYSGVYGELSGSILNDKANPGGAIPGGAIPLGTRAEIAEGEAYIYTTVDGDIPQVFKVEIEKISETSSQGKDMVIRVTDERLLALTGGIVQGMSGSPIIQGGKLVGAVTHVFVNNPEKGYAIFADTMYGTCLIAGTVSTLADAA